MTKRLNCKCAHCGIFFASAVLASTCTKCFTLGLHLAKTWLPNGKLTPAKKKDAHQ